MNNTEALQYIYEKLPMYHKIGSLAYKPGLENIEQLCEALGNPHKKFKAIHVAGTNGKGSTSHFLSAMLQCAGYKTGLFTSPHLKNFTERIKINGQEASQRFVTEFINQNQVLIETLKPSFFEITTIMAFLYFANEKVDYAIIEVGLGGRLDATNIIVPELSIITNISYDHQDLLGNTLAEIATEKAGIIKQGVPVIISENQPEIRQVFIDKAKKENAEIYFTDDITIEDKGIKEGKRIANVKVKDELQMTNVKCGLAGIYQLKNLKGILKAWQLLDKQGVTINKIHLFKALLKVIELTNLKGRWQILSDRPLTICDTGHNEAGIALIVDQIKSTPFEHLFMVIGMVNDKDHDKILALLPKEAYYIFTQAPIERAISASDLAIKAEKHELRGEIIKDVNNALRKAQEMASTHDLVFIGGSTFVVAEIDGL